MNLLVINPNTSEPVTARLQQAVRAALDPEVDVSAVTARFGSPYIASEVSFAVAEHAVIDGWKHAMASSGADAKPDAVLIGCFGDPGVFALRECAGVPVVGLAEAAFARAALGGRFAVVTGGRAWEPILRRLALVMGYAEAMAALEIVDASGAELAADQDLAVTALTAACRRAAANREVRSIIVGGAGLSGLARLLQADVDVPLIDSVEAGARDAIDRARKHETQGMETSSRR